jgi:integrase
VQASGCLRVSEIAGLRLDDVQTNLLRPVIRIRPELSKGGRGRMIPLWWDAGTLTDLAARKAERLKQGANPHDPFVCALSSRGPLSRQALRFRTACKVLGPERTARLTIHHGRHTFISHALSGSRTLAEVRDAAGHTNLIVTSAYLHLAVDDDGRVGNLFGFA